MKDKNIKVKMYANILVKRRCWIMSIWNADKERLQGL